MPAKKEKEKEKEQEPLFPAKQSAGEIIHCFTCDFTRLSNVHMISDTVLLTAAGNLVLLVDVATGKLDSWVLGLDGGGIGTICAHPSNGYFAVAEKVGSQSPPGVKPNVYIYSYPDKKLYKTLRDGTEMFYTAASFSSGGDKLATVGGDPDFMLTVWRWESESVILRFKAWGSEVFRVTFNQYDDGYLTTSGNGHIKFWEMARTFTGLKLQGAIGKFGKTDIQDIMGYTELPDNKVLSGSQTGDLLMWEGNLLKVEVKREGGRQCHDGPIEFVTLLEETNSAGEVQRVFLSAGNDGYMRYWKFGDIDMVDSTDGEDGCPIPCLKEVLISSSCTIRYVARTSSRWVIQDANGAYWSTPILTMAEVFDEKYTPDPATLLVRSHAGAVTCVEASPVDYTCVTAGQDGTMRLWDILTNCEVYSHQFSAPFTFLQWLPKEGGSDASLIVAGFANGAFRVVRRVRSEFQLCYVAVPHTGAITSVSFDADYKWAATTSDDGSIFFFTIQDLATKWTPVGESSLPSPASASHWEGASVVVGLQNGEVLAVDRPDPASIDPEVTFVFECTYKQFRYLQKPKPPEKAVKKKEFGAEDDMDEEEEEEDDEGDEQEEQDEDSGPCPVNALLRLPKALGQHVVVAMNRKEGAYTYTGISWCPAGDADMVAEDPITNVAYLNTVVRRMAMSPMGTYLVMGCEDGTILLRDARGGDGATPLKRCYHMKLGHDGRPEVRQGGLCMPGTVTGVAMSFDESILLTVSEDGSFLTHRLTGVEGAAEPPIPSPVDKEQWALPLSITVEDVAEATPLSIQQMKDKEDKDRAYAAAQKKKMSLSEKVKALQVEYQAIVDENATATQGKKMNKEELELDPEITQLLHDENERKIQEIERFHAWDTAKADISKKKLESTYINCLQVERIELHAFASGKRVASFRTPELTERQKEKISQVHDLIMNENHKRGQQHEEKQSPGSPVLQPVGTPGLKGEDAPDAAAGDAAAAASTSAVAVDPAAASTAKSPATSSGLPDLNPGGTLTSEASVVAHKKKDKSTHVKSQLEKAEERKRQRMERKALQDELLSKRPSADQEDPRDLAAIQRAERGMGDKKLKTDPNYIVKETERVTAERKERQLILLEESITTLRLDFNERFLAMRDLKERLVANINKDLRKIEQINTRLKMDDKRDLFQMSDSEVPDKIRLIPPTREQLQNFERERAKARRKAEKEAKAKSGFGGDLGGGDDEEENEAEAKVEEGDRITQARRASLRVHNQRRESHTITAEMRMQLELKGKLERLSKSALEEQEDAITHHKLLFERQKLERKIEKTVTTFDDALDELRREKLKLEGDLKMADIRVLLLYRELVLLKEFKKRDEMLSKKLEDHRSEKLEVTKKTNECQDRLNQKKVEIKHLLEVEQANMNAMLKLLSGLPQNIRDQLMKIFRKKVKRKMKKNDDEDCEEEEEESSDEDWDSDEGDETNEEEEDACPEGCEESVYEDVLALRLKRLDQEDVVTDFQKSMDQLKKENEQLTKREKATNSKLQQVEKEIQEFQTEKQQKLNQLETSIVLKLSQVQALNTKNKLPFDKTNLVVFTNSGMRDLFSRIGQLQTDKKVLNREHNEHKRTHCQLYKEKKAAEAHVKEWEQKVFEVQLLKFGQKVDLESLEDVSVDRKTEELKEKLRDEELHWEHAMRVQMQALKKLKQQQQEAISVNSKLLKELADLRQEQHRLEDHLNVSQHKILSRMAGGSRIATAADRANLKDLVVMQQREIDALKSEIAMLRRKGGHVYTPVVSKVVTADTSSSKPAAVQSAKAATQ